MTCLLTCSTRPYTHDSIVFAQASLSYGSTVEESVLRCWVIISILFELVRRSRSESLELCSTQDCLQSIKCNAMQVK